MCPRAPICASHNRQAVPAAKRILQGKAIGDCRRSLASSTYRSFGQMVQFKSGRDMTRRLDCFTILAPFATEQYRLIHPMKTPRRLCHCLRVLCRLSHSLARPTARLILTPVARPSLPTAPMHAMDAPTAGTGKSALVDIASMIVTGHRAAVISQGNNEAELEKRLGASLIAGDALISIDNCERPLGGETLCQALTQERIKVRILGQSKYVEAPTKAVFFATGNNLVMVGDMCRRALKCSLDAGLERPERRQFSSDPIKTIAANRERYVEAAITVLRAFEVAGRPKQARSLGGFEDWSSRVRHCLIWLGRADPCETWKRLEASIPLKKNFALPWSNGRP